MLLAAIDIGTNSIHMVIARATGPTGFEVVDREREVVQIGRGSFDSGRLRPEAIQRTLSSLARFVQLARSHQVDRILCTTTAAVREAANGGEFLREARRIAGVTPRVIPAEEEGRLIYLGIRSSLELGDEAALVVDIGGGSMQLAVGNAQKCLRVTSAPLGALRLTETYLQEDPPSRRDLARLKRTIRKRAKEALEVLIPYEPSRVYGSSGSIHALAHAAHWMETGKTVEQLNGHFLPIASLRKLAKKLEGMSLAEREKLPGLDARRAEIILPGALVLLHVLAETGMEGITVSDFSLREGLVSDYVARHGQEISALEKVESLRLRSVLRLLAKFQADGPHPRHVAKLALALFDGLAPLHELGSEDREMLEYAALLHDVGSVIGYDGHAEHSYYIIKNGNLRGLTAEEVDCVANVARYHEKRRPRKRDPNYRSLDKTRRRAVKWMAAILRVAEELDRSQFQLVKDVRVARRRGRVDLLLRARGDAQLELWAAKRRTQLLAELVGGPVRVGLDPALRRSRDAAAAASKESRADGRASEAESPRASAPSPEPATVSASAAPAPPPASGRGSPDGRGDRAARRDRGSRPETAAGRGEAPDRIRRPADRRRSGTRGRSATS